jgi:hypothetical protein
LLHALTINSCECGTEFCYICGDNWAGIHGCPHYGPAVYDDDDYNQDGYHRATGLNREGYTRREQRRINQDIGSDEEDEEEEEEEEEEEDNEEEENRGMNHPEWDILQHTDPYLRAEFRALPHDEREMWLVNLQIRLFEERGIIFPGPEQENQNDDSEGEEDSENEEEDDAGQDNDAEADREDKEHAGLNGSGLAAEGEGEGTSENEIGEEADFRADGAAMAVVRKAFEDLAERGTTLDQLISHADDVNVGNADDGRNEVEEGTQSASMIPAEMIETLRIIHNQLERGNVSLALIRSLLAVLEATDPEEENTFRLRLYLSRLNNSFTRNQTGQDENGGSPSATSRDEDQPATPMEVDSPIPAVEEGREERSAWKGPPGGWPDDEEL